MTDLYIRNVAGMAEANAAFQQGAFNHVDALCVAMLQRDPNHADARNLLAAVAVQVGRFDVASNLLARAIETNGKIRELHHNRGNVLLGLGEMEAAIASFRAALRLEPQAVDSLFELAVACAATGRASEAMAAFRAIVAFAPQVGEGYHRIGILNLERGENLAAIADFRRAIVCRSDFPDSHTNRAILLREEGRFAEAMRAFRIAVLLRPDDSNCQGNLGSLYKELGRNEDYNRCLDLAVALDPDDMDLRYAQAAGRSFKEGDPRLDELRDLARRLDRFDRPAQVKLRFALAKAHEDLGQAARSFEHQIEGNRLKRAATDYDEKAQLGHFERLKSVFTAELLASRRKEVAGDPSDLPIFVLGMPRSGSSLIEQILATHPRAFGAGELVDLPVLARALGPDEGPHFPEYVARMKPAEFAEFGARYVAGLKAKAPSMSRIVDKLPDNFRMIGMIHLALPNAKIIHTKRDAVDTCLSIYSKLFTADIPYSYDLAELGRYWRAYDSVMAHWRQVLPAGAFHEVDYEAMVADQEGETRKLLDYCGLDWDPACLQFHKTERIVRTASASQVKRPMYKSSVGRWRPDDKLLAPLLRELARHPREGGDPSTA